MTILKIAWRNIWRNPRRSILTLLALACSTALLLFMFAWQNGSYDSMIHAVVSTTTGEMQVLHRDYQDNPGIRKAIDDPAEVLARLQSMADVAACAPRAEGFGLIDSGKRSCGVMVVGVDPTREPAVSNIRSTIREGSYFTGSGNEILLGTKLARNLHAGVGDEVVILGQGYDGSVAANAFTVCGLVESGQPELDRSLAEIPLSLFDQTFFMGGRVHRIVINCSSLEVLERTADDLSEWLQPRHDDLTVLTWDGLVPGLKQSIELDLLSGYIFYFLLLVVVAFSIMNTFIMAVLERSRELGVLNAIGTSRRQLARMLFLETILLGLCGVAAGLAGGLLFTGYYQEVGFVIPEAESLMAQFGLPERIHPKLSTLVVWVSAALVMGVTILSTIYPALRVLRLNPVQAMHDQ